MSSEAVIAALIAAVVSIIGSAVALALGVRSIRLEQGKLQVEKERLELERNKLDWDQHREFTFETLQILFELNGTATSMLYHLDHVYKIIKMPSGSLLRPQHRSYTVGIMCFGVAKLLATIQSTHRVELRLVLRQPSVKVLEDLTQSFCQFFSDCGILRDYQVQLAEESKVHKTARSFYEANAETMEAYKLVESWAEELVDDYETALFALEQARTRPYPSLKERGVYFASRKIADVGPLRLTDTSAAFLSILVNLTSFVPGQDLKGLESDVMHYWVRY